ncbi:MAG: hypothetical protein QG583_909 [Patescibacteria group bacterium]|nr:hypothetical protein [Patescibacteria group bacterium]
MSNLLKSKFLLGVLVVVGLAFAGSASAAYMHTGLLKMGQSSSQVMSLQQTLNSGGFLVSTTGAGSPGMESMYFGAKTKAAVMAFQAAKGLTVDGVVGAQTGAALAAMTGGTVAYPAGCTSTTGFSTTTGMSCSTGSTTLPAGCTAGAMYSSTTGMLCSGGTTTTPNGPLAGGAGSLDDVQSISSLSGEEVAEGDSDTKIAGWTFTADNGSDLAISTIRLSFDLTAGAGSDQFDDYADKVTVWQGSTEVGSADVADFSENSNVYSKTINLSGVTPIKADKDSDFFVTVDALNNIDSSDLGANTWTMTLESVRYEDATGVVSTETATGDIGGTTAFSFESLATATGTELKVSDTTGSSGDAVNDGHVVEIDATTDTNDVPLLAFDLKATGDIQNIQDIPVKVVSTGTGQVTDIASSFSLWMDGEMIDTVSSADLFETSVTENADLCDNNDTTCWAHFDDVDFDMNDGDSAHFVVKADINDTSATLVNGDTLTVSMTATDVDAIDAEDANGDSVVAGDLTGTATAETIAFYTAGINASLYGTPTAVISHTGDIVGSGAGDDDQGTFEIIFDVTAFGSDIYLDGTSPTLTGAGALLDLNLTETGTHALTSATITSPSGATLTGTANADARFKIAEGDTERFKVTAVLTVSVDGFASIAIGDIVYALTDVTGTTSYTFNLADFKTGDLYMNAN